MAEIKYLGSDGLKKVIKRNDERYASISHKHQKSDITDLIVDSELSSTSTNLITNKAVAAAIEDVEDIAKDYTDTKIENMVGTSSVSTQISTHNTSITAHNDIRDLISTLTNRLNAVANSTDEDLDTLNEIVTYIKSNKSLIDSITTTKVNVSDIIDNLTTSVSNKPLSAKQGVALKSLIDTLQEAVNGKSDDSHGHAISDITNLQSTLDGKANVSHGNHVPTTETANNAKFLRNDNTWQTVTPENIGAAASSHGTHVSYSSTAPVMDGTASAGSASTVARSDHKHPTDTSRASKTEFDEFKTDINSAKVSKSGDTMSGYLNFEKNVNGTVHKASIGASSNGNTYIQHYTNGTLDNYITLSGNASFASKPWSIDSGGTGANTAAGALSNLGLTATATELNYMDGVTSNVQTQINSVQATADSKSIVKIVRWS